MASLMAAAATAAPGKVQFHCCEVDFASPAGRRATHVLPSRSSLRRRVGGDSGRRRCGVAIRASSSGTADDNVIPESGPSDAGGCSSFVDANMMVLRRRIECMRMKETFVQTPEEWMAWEKSCYNSYRADVNILVACLQSQLLGMRPSVVLFIISFLLAATPVAFLLLISAVGSQLYTLNNNVLDFLAPCSSVTPLL